MRFLCALAMLSFFSVTEMRAQKTLAVIGSSTSACSGATGATPQEAIMNCYIGRLRTYYDKNSNMDTIVNNGFAVPGYTVFQGMPTSYTTSPYQQPDPAHNITAALNSHPSFVLVNYPTNGYDEITIDSAIYALRTIRDSANIKGIPCFITTTQPRTSYPADVRAKLKDLKDRILTEFGAFAVNFWDGLANPADNTIMAAYDADGIHLNNDGHAILAQRVIAANVFSATLPATFLQFNTINKNNSNVISWTTAKETQVAYYEIQRSPDGTSFSKIGTVTASNGNGNNQYQYTDDQPLKGWGYYKILIVDKDGKKQGTPVMSVHISNGNLALLKAFAHTSSQVIIELQNNDPQNAEVQIFNNMGMLISKTSHKIEPGTTTLYLNTAVLSNGVYHIKVITPKESVTGSFVKNQ